MPKVSLFAFDKAANDELANLIARAYKVHLKCGGEVNPDVEAMALKQVERKKRDQEDKRLDKFELIKCQIAEGCKQLDVKIELKLKEPGPEINTQIQYFFLEVQGKLDELKQLQRDCESRSGLWAKITKTPKKEVLEERRNDIKNIEDYINDLKSKNRGQGKSMKQEEMKSKDTLDGMEDMSKESGIPGVNISEGLKQIEENKVRIAEGIRELIGQVDDIKKKADEIKNELEKQEKLLDQIEKDVTKYDKDLGDLNKKMDKALQAVGGPLKMILGIIILIVIIAIIAVVYVIVENSLK